MISNDLGRSLPSLFSELVHGAPEEWAFVLNGGDPGLLATLDGLSADAASESSAGGATVAAHADHLRYGISLMNRWAGGKNPFLDADWSTAWKREGVSENEWAVIRKELRAQADRWHAALQEPRELAGFELDGVVASLIHVAYHLGAIRQISPASRGPREGREPVDQSSS